MVCYSGDALVFLGIQRNGLVVTCKTIFNYKYIEEYKEMASICIYLEFLIKKTKIRHESKSIKMEYVFQLYIFQSCHSAFLANCKHKKKKKTKSWRIEINILCSIFPLDGKMQAQAILVVRIDERLCEDDIGNTKIYISR